MAGNELFEFGPFRLDPKQRELTRAGAAISLTPKAFDVLVVLVQHRGQLVTKADVLSAVWPGTAVEEGNLAWNVSAIRKALADDAGSTYIETVPKFGYRFVADVREVFSDPEPTVGTPLPASPINVADSESAIRRRGRVGLYVAALAVLAMATAALTYPWSRTPILTERDWILVASVENRTGEADFDDVLTDTVAIQFDQSPYFRVFSRDRTDEQLRSMRRQAGEPITDAVAREICERAGVKAFVIGSIARLGPDYVITLSAVNAQTGDAVARNQQTVRELAGVLPAIGTASAAIRRGLGESLQSIQQFDVPAEVATTASLPALRAYREGMRLMAADQSPKAVPLFQRAIQLDPDFALAYARLSAVYANVNDRGQAAWAAGEAFNRRDRASERERHEIVAKYYRDVTGEASKAIEAMQLWAEMFPDDPRAHNTLQIYLRDVGRVHDAAKHGEHAVRLDAGSPTFRTNLIGSYIRIGNFAAAREVRDQTERDGLATATARRLFRNLAAITDDSAAMQKEDQWRQTQGDRPSLSDFVPSQSGVAGRLSAARTQYQDLIRRAISQQRTPLANDFLSRLVMLEVLLDPNAAVASAQELLGRDPSRYARVEAAFAFVVAKGDVSHLKKLTDDLPEDEILKGLWMPMAQAVSEIRLGRPSNAVPLLRSLDAYDLGDYAALRPSYFLGQAYLAVGAAPEARAAFEKIVRNRGVTMANPLYALAHLGLARSAALAGAEAEAREFYAKFFAIWKDADADLAVMKAARTEYARLMTN